MIFIVETETTFRETDMNNIPKVGDLIKLVGISRHGKNRINEHGNAWLVKAVKDGRVSLSSLENTFKSKTLPPSPDGRWVQLRDDENFEIIRT
jgi:hypothetical protein